MQHEIQTSRCLPPPWLIGPNRPGDQLQGGELHDNETDMRLTWATMLQKVFVGCLISKKTKLNPPWWDGWKLWFLWNKTIEHIPVPQLQNIGVQKSSLVLLTQKKHGNKKNVVCTRALEKAPGQTNMTSWRNAPSIPKNVQQNGRSSQAHHQGVEWELLRQLCNWMDLKRMHIKIHLSTVAKKQNNHSGQAVIFFMLFQRHMACRGGADRKAPEGAMNNYFSNLLQRLTNTPYKTAAEDSLRDPHGVLFLGHHLFEIAPNFPELKKSPKIKQTPCRTQDKSAGGVSCSRLESLPVLNHISSPWWFFALSPKPFIASFVPWS